MSTPMRILTVRQPWAWAIIHGGKDVENRVRNLAGSWRGTIAIHVALQHDLDRDHTLVSAAIGAWRRANPGVSSADNPDPMRSRPTWYGHLGCIIGVVDLVDVHGSYECTRGDCLSGETYCSPWAEDDTYHLVLANPRPLSEPIPYRGALGLRTVPAELQARIEAAL